MSSASSQTAGFVAGRYLLRARIGVGAAGEVWSAVDPGIGRRVAVKFLRIPEGLSPHHRAEWESRFLLEARAAGRLSHPGIVSVYDVGTASDDRPFIVMELVEGQSLEAVRQSPTRPPLERVVAWTEQVAQALDAAHRSGVIHRDVKPANILVGVDGRARIADFGIARVSESELTRDGTFVGSPAFAAPEQLCGAKVDGRADVFALAAVFYLLTTGRRPFEGDDIPSIVYAVCHLEPEPPGLGALIDAVILRALAKSPDARFATAGEFGEALAAAASPEGLPVPVDSAEARAGSIGSAAAVAILRGWRAIAWGTREAAAATLAWARRTAPRIRAAALRVDRKRWWQAAAVLLVVGGALVVAHALREQSHDERRGQFLERIRAAVGSKATRVSLVVGDVPAGGTVEVREGNQTLARAAAGTGTPAFRLSPGDHTLALAVIGPDGLDLRKTVDVEVEPRSAYELQVSVATWPWTRVAADWDRISD